MGGAETIDLSFDWGQSKPRREALTPDHLFSWIQKDFLLLINGMLGTATKARLQKCPLGVWQELLQRDSYLELQAFLHRNEFQLEASTPYGLEQGQGYVDLLIQRAPAPTKDKKWYQIW